jgi:hypothetical protein
LWGRDPEDELLPTVRELDIGYVAYRITLTSEDLERIDQAAPKGAATGARYEDMDAVNL